ncbi:MAG TPA: ricin-type beta-trefoil lectin domain protein [Actinocrinis sp.]|nr:ricin-type beta-trefoil lectin domain protein [Actinocrinis sp.]
MPPRLRRLFLVLLTLLATGALVSQSAYADDTTVSYDTLRTGWDPNEPGLSPAAVPGSGFGQLFSTAVTGQVYAQPLVVGNTLVAATEANNIYGINATTGAVLWSRNVGAPEPIWTTCGDLTPQVGITSTPVYDPATKSVFFLAKVNDGPHYYLHSVDLATGAERSGWPIAVSGTPSNDSAHPFDSATALQRPGLLLLGGVVYAAFGSSCDQGSYDGYVAGFNTTTPTMSTLWSAEAGSADGEAAIWQSGGGLVSDGPGRIIFTSGNGFDPPKGPGNNPPATLGDSVVRLQVNANGSLSAKDFFSPNNNAQLSAGDSDFGSGGPLALPNGFGTTAHPDLLVQVGKDGRVFLLDRDNLGGMGQGPGGSDNSVGPPVGPFNGLWGHPAFWGGDGGYVYDVENGGPLRALKYSVNANGLPQLTSAGTSSATFALGAGSPLITSSGSTSGSAVLWVVHTNDDTGVGATLQAYNPVPQSGKLTLLWSASIGTAAKFTVPAANAGRVYLGTRDGHILAFGPTTTTGGTGPVTSGVTGKCLDDNNSGADATPVIIYDCNGGANQNWTFTNGTLQINGKCADVTGQGTANGTKVELWDCNGGTNQQWTAQSNGELVSTASGRCLDDPGFSTVNQTQVVIWDCNNGANQHWALP